MTAFSRVYTVDASPKTLVSPAVEGTVLKIKALIIHNTGAADATVSFQDGSTSIIGDITVSAGSRETLDSRVLTEDGIRVESGLAVTSSVTDGSVKVTVVFEVE